MTLNRKKNQVYGLYFMKKGNKSRLDTCIDFVCMKLLRDYVRVHLNYSNINEPKR